MAKVRFTSALRRFYPDLSPMTMEEKTIADLIAKLDQHHPGISAYLIDDNGALRKHVNIFIGEEMIQDKIKLSDTVLESDEVFILQSLSGG